MASLGKLMIGFAVLSICIIGMLLIFTQNESIHMSNVTLGNLSEYTCSTSAINITTGLVTQTTSFGTMLGFAVMFVLMALCVIAVVALFSRKGR